MIQDDLIVKLGQSQQKVMSLTVRCRHLEMAEQRARERAEVLEELVNHLRHRAGHAGQRAEERDPRAHCDKVMQKLDEEQPDD
jgi:hypothetical protein